MGGASATPTAPLLLWVWSHKWGIVHVNLVPATYPTNFSLIASIGKQIDFDFLILVAYIGVKWKILSSEFFSDNIWPPLEDITSKKALKRPNTL